MSRAPEPGRYRAQSSAPRQPRVGAAAEAGRHPGGLPLFPARRLTGNGLPGLFPVETPGAEQSLQCVAICAKEVLGWGFFIMII